MAKVFVYVNGLRGPEPQTWDPDVKRESPKAIEGNTHLLTADDPQDFVGLMAKYPYVQPKEKVVKS